MGQLESAVDWTGRDVNGTTLGSPSRTSPGDPYATPPVAASGGYVWDHQDIPNGTIDVDGDIWVEVLI